MTRQHTRSRSPKAIAAITVGFGLAVLFGKLDGPAAQLTSLLGTDAREALNLLLYFVPVAWQALQGYALEHLRFSPCLVHMLVSFWPLLHVMAVAA